MQSTSGWALLSKIDETSWKVLLEVSRTNELLNLFKTVVNVFKCSLVKHI